MSRRGAVLLAVMLVAAGMWPAIGATAPSGTPGISPSTQVTSVTADVLTEPMPVKASDGQYHLAYELLITNVRPGEIDMNTVEVRDASSHDVLLRLAGAALATRLNPVGTSRAAAGADTRIASSKTSI